MEIRQIFWLLPTTLSLPRKRQRPTLLLLLHSDWLFLVKGFSSFLLGDVWQGVRHYYYPHRERKECRNHSSQKCWSRDPLSCWQQRALWSTDNRVLSHWRSKKKMASKKKCIFKWNALYVNYPTYFRNLEKELQYRKVDCLILISNFKILSKSW